MPWQNLWIDTNIDPRDIGQEWEIDTPTPPERYCVCIQRCNPPEGIKLFDCLINAAFVRHYSGCNKIISVGTPMVKAWNRSWPVLKGTGWY